MPQPTARRRADQPTVSRVCTDTWETLLATADDFNRLAPWEWMHDSHVIGMRHPVTKEVLLGSIVGRLRQVFGLLLYRNDAGRRWLLSAIMNDGEFDDFEREDRGFQQDMVKLEFTVKRELWKEDRAMLDAVGYVPAAKRGHVWPQFRSLVPGSFPWHVMQAEAETLLFALPRVAAVARLMRAQPSVWDDHCDGEIGFVPNGFDPAAGELGAHDLAWQPMVPPPAALPERVSLDEATTARLLKLAPAKGFHLELDVAHANFSIADVDRPRFPKLAMAVDRASGFIGGFHLGDSQDHDGARALGKVLQNALTQLGHRPETIRVQRSRVAAMLTDAAKALGIPVVQDEELAELNHARESMEQRFGGRR